MKSTHRRYGARRGALVTLALATIAVLLAGCGGGGSSSSDAGVAHIGSSASSSSTSTASAGSSEERNPAEAQKAMVAYARCMRSHGVPSFPEPTEGHISIKRGGADASNGQTNTESAAFQAADKTCRKLLPNGGTPSPQQQAKAQEAALNFSRCMRSHGAPNFPTPKFNGGQAELKASGNGLNPSSPQFKAAAKACQSALGPGGGQIAVG